MCRQIFWRNQKTNKSKNIVWWLFGVVACRFGLVWEVSKRWIRNGLSRVWDCVHFFRHEFTLTIFPYYKFSKFYSIKLKEIHELCIWLRVSHEMSVCRWRKFHFLVTFFPMCFHLIWHLNVVGGFPKMFVTSFSDH